MTIELYKTDIDSSDFTVKRSTIARSTYEINALEFHGEEFIVTVQKNGNHWVIFSEEHEPLDVALHFTVGATTAAKFKTLKEAAPVAKAFAADFANTWAENQNEENSEEVAETSLDSVAADETVERMEKAKTVLAPSTKDAAYGIEREVYKAYGKDKNYLGYAQYRDGGYVVPGVPDESVEGVTYISFESFNHPARVIDLDDLQLMIEGDNYEGVCRECGGTRGGCEPDAEDYLCYECGEYAVDGAENILITWV